MISIGYLHLPARAILPLDLSEESPVVSVNLSYIKLRQNLIILEVECREFTI